MKSNIAKAACAALMTSVFCTGAGAALGALAAGPATAQTAGFVAIGDFAEYRIDGVRKGTHGGASVRFLDMTLRNKSNITTFPGTIQEVRWQGRTSGSEVRALKRDLTAFGMYDQTVAPGQTVRVTYVVPDREDIDGVTVEYPRANTGPKKRVFSWDELAMPG